MGIFGAGFANTERKGKPISVITGFGIGFSCTQHQYPWV
jgi:hypothetical protein